MLIAWLTELCTDTWLVSHARAYVILHINWVTCWWSGWIDMTWTHILLWVGLVDIYFGLTWLYLLSLLRATSFTFLLDEISHVTCLTLIVVILEFDLSLVRFLTRQNGVLLISGLELHTSISLIPGLGFLCFVTKRMIWFRVYGAYSREQSY